MTDKRAVVVLSGGMDSTVLLDKMIDEGWLITSCVSFNYGQRHKKELEFASKAAQGYSIKHHLIDLWSSGITEALAPSGSSLITDTDVPDGHYAEETMKATVVPNRNMMMISMAGAIAVSEGANAIALGVHAGDHFIYPDCRIGFVGVAALALYLGNEDFGELWRAPIYAPFIGKTKAEIAEIGFRQGTRFNRTWSCYKGGESHCGKCGTCVERLEALDEAATKLNKEYPTDTNTLLFVDETVYEDAEYWKGVTLR